MRTLTLFWAILLLFSCQTVKQDKAGISSSQITIFDNELTIEGLDRPRTIRVYTPPGYADGDQNYPVIYMHDGQNLFEDSTSFAGEWGVDENLDSISKINGLDLIVVGIDNGGENRIHELTAWDHPRYGKAEGKAYMEFIVNTVKPFIDSKFRTKPERQHTAIMGSSLGGLISHYAIYEYPEVFSKAGIFSPSYWWGKGPFDQVEQKKLPNDTRLAFLMGGKEGDNMVKPMQQMVSKILANGHSDTNLTSIINPEGEHNEKLWRSEFQEAILWLFQ
ncbi:alpha/beta hydrolase [Roseivirga misakiensis]|uniref:Esterase n=1 Tax=Roseivirga misakiensis TaxID=1563681 RepID=A0A1E5T4P4_9BACT|nr:alpha/beta hydrolase-fold protein [Roseivirga misakiensis]OEK06348.1 esterase [Roseivirga misakiensis]